MKIRTKTWLIAILVCLLSSLAFAVQRGSRRGWFDGDITTNRNGVPTWEIDPAFKDDVFTFVRVRFDSPWGRRGGGGGGWATDFPDSDLNFSLRLQQLTSIKVNPNPIILDLSDPKLFDYPFLYMIEPGQLMFSPEEVLALRKYCRQGGFLMVDDFWGEDQWENFYAEMKRVFPDREAVEVPLEHEIFHSVYDMKEKPQVPSIHAWERGGVTYERGWYGDTSTVHFKAFSDDDGRIMVFICHNTDLGDGWEREGENHEYFTEFSVKKSYPMGINIVTYAMTH